MKTKKVGLIASPDMPADLAGKITDNLQKGFKNKVDSSVYWELESLIDPLVGSAEYINEMIDKANDLKHQNEWDYTICLTDLPQFIDNEVVLADINKKII